MRTLRALKSLAPVLGEQSASTFREREAADSPQNVGNHLAD